MSVGIGVASGGFRREVRLLNVEDPASTCGLAYWQCLCLQVGSWNRGDFLGQKLLS